MKNITLQLSLLLVGILLPSAWLKVDASNVIEIPITNQPIGSRYRLTWYDSETGYPFTTNAILYTIVQLNAVGDKVVSFNFPSSIRDLQYQTINNVFGDVVFSLVLDNLPSDSQQ